MLVVKPDPNNETSEVKTLNAFLDGEPCGAVRFKLNGYIIVITELYPLPADPSDIDRPTFSVLDTVMRALGSWGLNHSCYYLECRDPMLYPTLEALRFTVTDGICKSDLSKVLRHNH